MPPSVQPEPAKVVRPTAGGAVLVVFGVALWVPFAFMLLGLAATDGSYWSILAALSGLVFAWLRARTLTAVREGDTVVVRNFYSTRKVAVDATTVVRPFHHWAEGKIAFMAIHTPGRSLRSVHASVLPGLRTRADRDPQAIADTLRLRLDVREVGTFRQLLRRW